MAGDEAIALSRLQPERLLAVRPLQRMQMRRLRSTAERQVWGYRAAKRRAETERGRRLSGDPFTMLRRVVYTCSLFSALAPQRLPSSGGLRSAPPVGSRQPMIYLHHPAPGRTSSRHPARLSGFVSDLGGACTPVFTGTPSPPETPSPAGGWAAS